MLNPAIQSKVERGEELTEAEAKEFFVTLNEEAAKLEKEDPKLYLRMLTNLTKIITDLNRDVKAVLRE